MNTMNKRHIHFNGKTLIDLSYKYEEDTELFLDYLAIFTSSYIIPTKSSNVIDISLLSLIMSLFNIDNNLYFNPEFNNKELKLLFDRIYCVSVHKIEDAFQNKKISDNINKLKFKETLNALDNKYKGNNINIPVCTLLKYLEHRSFVDSDILKGGDSFGVRSIIHNNMYENPDIFIDEVSYYNIDISNFIKYKEDLIEFKNVLKYILLVTKLLKKFLNANLEMLSIDENQQILFLDKLIKFNDDLSPKNKNFINIKYSVSGLNCYNIGGIAKQAKLSFIPTDNLKNRQYSIMQCLNFYLIEKFDSVEYQLKDAIMSLNEIKEKNLILETRYKSFYEKMIYLIHTFIYNKFRYLKVIYIFIRNL